MPPAARSLAERYGFALLAAAVALLARLALDPLLGDALPFLLACVAVVAAAWHGGFGPSALALALGTLATAYFFLTPRYSLAESLAGHRTPVFGFLFLGLIIGLFSERLRAARRRAEEHAREAVRQRQELEQEVTRRKRLEEELQRRAEELAAADRRKDEFLAVLSHELRGPLAPIRNALQVQRLLGPADPRFGEARDLIDRQVRHLARLVDDLLDVSRVTRGKVTLHKGRLDVAEVLAAAAEAARPAVVARGHRLGVTPPADRLWVEGDLTRLAQVVGNLVTNAAKYTPDGGDIRLTAGREGDQAVIRVRDTGVGIAADLLPRVFDLFTQGQPSPGGPEGGLGIGLTVVKALAEMHGGSVEAHSDGPGQGSEFVVRLPALPPGQEGRGREVRPAGRAAPGVSSARRVLVVDDNRDAADSLALVLRAGGHEVRVAYDGRSALQEARAFRPELVILDIGLPGGLDGYEVARRLRQEAGCGGAVLAALTGFGQEEDRRRAQEAGFDAHLVKPADPDALQALLARRTRGRAV
jgi:signal transduction histidine kinase/ActR/RegA family two-component response regulator